MNETSGKKNEVCGNIKNKADQILENLFLRYSELQVCRVEIGKAYRILKACYDRGGKVLVCGNGGSAADSEHIVGELMKGFMKKRCLGEVDRKKLHDAYPPEGAYLAEHLQGALPALSLTSHPGLSTAFINDVAADMVFAQQVYGYANEGDVLIGLSTSGNSINVIRAIQVAKAFGLLVIGFTGEHGGKVRELCDALVAVPAKETYRVQELHLPVYHALCAMIEAEYFPE